MREYDLEVHKIAVLHQLCRAYDMLDDHRGAYLADGGAMVDGKVHPAAVESRLLWAVVAKLTTTLNLPEDVDE